MIKKLGNTKEGFRQARSIYDASGIAPTLLAAMSHGNTVPYIVDIIGGGKMAEPNIDVKGLLEGNGFELKRRIYGVNGIAPTLDSAQGGDRKIKILEEKEMPKYRIRRLTPVECLRLMDVSEDDIKKIMSTVSETQAYKQAGNSIVVNVMCEMFKNLNIKQRKDDEK